VPVRPAAAAGPVHLTRRGRVVVLVTLLLALALATLVLTGPLLSGTAADAGTATSHPATRTVVVEPGQTLWQIAAQADPHADVRDTVAKIMELNALSDSVVRPGTRIAVPLH
jgi:LysM repeat protein